MDDRRLQKFINRCWNDEIIPTLVEYIKIPNKSPLFDPEWAKRGYMDEAVALFEGWARAKIGNISGASVDVVRLPGRTPLILIEVPGGAADTVVLYGHLDKQPEMKGWEEGFGPWVPRVKDSKLYGRGGADDGYAMFGALSAILALGEQGIPHARCVIIIEACEESGSYDLPHYMNHLAERIGTPSLVICLDSGCGNYDQLWLTTSLRGLVTGSLKVRVLEEGVHSGDASGIIPSSFRVLRSLISRIEDEATGAIRPTQLYVSIPIDRLAHACRAAEVLGEDLYAKFPITAGMSAVSDNDIQLVLNRSWLPQLAVTGIEGLPSLSDAGNVLLPQSAVKLSLRLPPTLDGAEAAAVVKELLEDHPPYDAEVTCTLDPPTTGWNSPALSPWLEDSLTSASKTMFGAPPVFAGEGGSIPFMSMLGKKFPQAQFVVTGLLGPHSNAHGPNEFLHIPTGKRLSAVIAYVLKDHALRPASPLLSESAR